jgi:glycosyltransferase involved in cell wall biosynthesis
MKWLMLAPFEVELNSPWLFTHVSSGHHEAQSVPKHYVHDRSRKASGLKEWRDFMRHGWAGAWKVRFGGPVDGVITAFPQLTAVMALFKLLRVLPRRTRLVAWYFNMSHPVGGFKGRLARAVMSQVDCFVVHSSAEIEIYSQWLNLPASRFRFVPLTAGEPASATPPDLNLPAAPYVIAMGTANRDYRTFLAAMARLQLPGLVICGPHALEGVEVPPLVEVRHGLSLAACHALARQARVNVIPIAQLEAASGQVTLIEAMMMGAALVVTRCIGSQDYVAHLSDAMLVPPGDVQAMADAIERLWRDDALHESLARAAKARALSQCTVEAVASNLLSVLEEQRAAQAAG